MAVSRDCSEKIKEAMAQREKVSVTQDEKVLEMCFISDANTHNTLSYTFEMLTMRSFF